MYLSEGRLRFVQSEQFIGVLMPLLMSFIGNSMRLGFEAMNQALRARVLEAVAV